MEAPADELEQVPPIAQGERCTLPLRTNKEGYLETSPHTCRRLVFFEVNEDTLFLFSHGKETAKTLFISFYLYNLTQVLTCAIDKPNQTKA